MAIVLIVDDMAIFREPIAAALGDGGFEILQAASGAEALCILRERHIDLVLLDVSMPEMDGITLLEHMRANEKWRTLPVILLTAVGNRDIVVRAAKLGVREYMLKSAFSLKELLTRVHKQLTGDTQADGPEPVAATINAPATSANGTDRGANTRNHIAKSQSSTGHAIVKADAADSSHLVGSGEKLVLLNREKTQSRLALITEARTCAGVVAQVISLANSARSDIADLVGVIESDPVLASRVMQLANSAMYRQKRGRLATIDEAVRNVGIRAIQNLVVSIGIFQAFPPDGADGFNTMRCWQHSFAVSAILRILMAHRTEDERERVALIGLCHDLGEIVLRQHFSAEYNQIVEHSIRTGQPVANVEAVALSMRHGELVNEVLTRIGLPTNIALPIMRFHEGGTTPAGENLQVVRLLQVANWVAHGMLLVPSSRTSLTAIPRADLKRACGRDQIDIDFETLRQEVVMATNVLARLPASDEARFVKPLYPRTDIQIWYARHAGYADMDPLEGALRMMAHVHADTRLPQDSGELDAMDLIIAASPFVDSVPLVMNDIRAIQKAAGYRGQPIVGLLGNAGGAVAVAGMTLHKLPVNLEDLARHIEQAPRRQHAAIA